MFDIEQYFRAASITYEEDKVYMASMYLSGDAKLWWRIKFDGAVCAIQTQYELKKELKNSFFPENVEYNTRKKLKELSHTGTVREYVRDFLALLLDIRGMSEKDKTFSFLEGLKHSVKRKAPTLAFDGASRGNGSQNGSRSRNGNGEGSGNGNGNENGLTNPKAARVDRTPTWGSDRGQKGDASRPGLEPNENIDPLDNTEEGPARVGSIHFLYDLRSELDKAEFEKERDLMYVDIELNGVASKALVDMGVTDTFITLEEVERCDLKLSKGNGRMKVVNSGAVVV
ncbi:hypothetical protein GQ457_08G017680 [Hibiscus cannabinus]